MSKEDKGKPQHRQFESVASVESEMGGYEQLKSGLIEEDAHDFLGEEVKVYDSLTIIKQSGGEGICLIKNRDRKVPETRAYRTSPACTSNFLNYNDDAGNDEYTNFEL